MLFELLQSFPFYFLQIFVHEQFEIAIKAVSQFNYWLLYKEIIFYAARIDF